MAQIQQQLMDRVPSRLRQLLAGNARRELLNQIEHCLLIFQDQLYCLDSGKHHALPDDRDAGSIADAARQLLSEADEDEAILLLLPPVEFVATGQVLPGVGRDNLFSAMQLQQETLLPTCESSLAMAINGQSCELGELHYALWISQQRLDSLYQAFAGQGLFLAAVKPRLLAIPGAEAEIRLIDHDPRGPTAVALLDGVITQWLQADVLDLEQEQFAQQWQQELNSRPTTARQEFSEAADYLDKADPQANTEYSFFPAGALTARKKVERSHRFIAAACVLLLAGFLSAVPFLLQSLQFRQAAQALAENRELASEARADQAVVVAFENQWGPLNDFPDQDVRQALFTLQEVLAPDRLASLEISEGLISIQGSSEAPQAILQRLEQDPLFTEVVFARATNNARYYIDLRLSTVNFDSYMLRYFPED